MAFKNLKSYCNFAHFLHHHKDNTYIEISIFIDFEELLITNSQFVIKIIVMKEL